MANGTTEGRDIMAGEGNPEGGGNIASQVRELELAERELWTAEEFEEAEPCDIIEISDKDLQEQKDILEKTFRAWKGKNEQVDDILIFGIKFI